MLFLECDKNNGGDEGGDGGVGFKGISEISALEGAAGEMEETFIGRSRFVVLFKGTSIVLFDKFFGDIDTVLFDLGGSGDGIMLSMESIRMRRFDSSTVGA